MHVTKCWPSKRPIGGTLRPVERMMGMQTVHTTSSGDDMVRSSILSGALITSTIISPKMACNRIASSTARKMTTVSTMPGQNCVWDLNSPSTQKISTMSTMPSTNSVGAFVAPGLPEQRAMSTVTSLATAREKLGSMMAMYEEYIGIAEVTAAQNRVLECEEAFLRAQAKRRDHQQHIHHVQDKLKDLHAEIAKTNRGEDRYLSLVTEEHRVLRDESRLASEFRLLERAEHELFQALSSAVRSSHEKERAHAERTKYWSLVGSLIGATIGIVGTSINNWLRMRELRGIAASSGELPTRLQGQVTALTDSVEQQRRELTAAIQHVQEQFGRPVSVSHALQPAAAGAAERFAAEVADQLRRLEQQQLQLGRQLAAAVRWTPAAGAGAEDVEQVQLALLEHERRVERRLMHESAGVALAGVLCGAALAALLARVFGSS